MADETTESQDITETGSLPATLSDTRRVGFDDEALFGLETLSDATALFGADESAVVDVSEYGTGFEVLEDKSLLVGRRMLILGYNENIGDYGYFVSMYVVTFPNDDPTTNDIDGKHIVNDGSTGIRDQLAAIYRRSGRDKLLLVPKGLRVSEYQYCETHSMAFNACRRHPSLSDQQHKTIPAHTYYLAF